jgi:cytochrome b561
MMLRNTRESWGGVAKTLHWSAAAAVFAMLGLGLTMVHGGLGAAQNSKPTNCICRPASSSWR